MFLEKAGTEPNNIMLPKLKLKIDKNISDIQSGHMRLSNLPKFLNHPPTHSSVNIVKNKIAVKNFCIKTPYIPSTVTNCGLFSEKTPNTRLQQSALDEYVSKLKLEKIDHQGQIFAGVVRQIVSESR